MKNIKTLSELEDSILGKKGHQKELLTKRN